VKAILSGHKRLKPARAEVLIRTMANAVRLLDVDRHWVAAARRVAKHVAQGIDDQAAKAYLAEVARTFRVVTEAKGRFVKANLRLAILLARKHKRSRLPMADLIQEANIGLMRAVDRFDPGQGFRFSTYGMWWIRHGINRALSDTSRLVRVPVHVLDSMAKIERESRAHLALNGCRATVAELAAATGFTTKVVQSALDASQAGAVLSLDQPVGGDNGDPARSYVDLLVDEKAPSVLDGILRAASKAQLHAALKRLDAREVIVLRLRFGICDVAEEDENTLQEVGNKIGPISRERVRQIQEIALAKLRRILREGQDAG
jgi:RNA polymerase primary sigma factor